MEIGGIFQYQGQLQEALSCFLESHSLYKEFGSETQIAWSLTDLGNIYQRLGEIDKSLEYYTKALPIYENSMDSRVLGNHLRAMAISYRIKGEYNKAIESNQTALDLYQQIGNENFMGKAYYQLSQDYFEIMDYSKATQYLDQAIAIFDQNQNDDYLARSYFRKIRHVHSLDRDKNVSTFIDALQAIDDRNSSPLIHQMLTIAKASQHLNSNRMRQIVIGVSTLEDIIEDELRDIEVSTYASFMLLEEYIKELSKFGSLSILDNINHLLDLVYNLAEQQSSPYLLAKVKLIDSRLQLLNKNIQGARSLIQQGQDLCKDYGFSGLLEVSQNLLNQINNEEKYLIDMFQQPNAIDTILESSGLINFIENLVHNQYTIRNEGFDQPYAIYIIRPEGFCIYSYTFQDLDIDPQLFSGFVIALSNFSKETFQNTQLLDQIKMGDVRIQVNNDPEHILCYLYQGSQTTATYKLQKLRDCLDQGSLPMITQSSSNQVIISDDLLLNIIEDIFL